MAHWLHCVVGMRRSLLSLLLLGGARSAFADCPTHVEDLPATGFLASATRIAMESAGIPQQHTVVPAVTMDIGASGGLRMDQADKTGTASIAGQVVAHGHGITACASGDVVDVPAGSVHTDASAQLPFLFTGLTFGGSWDRDVRLPLSASSAYLRAPLNRAAFQVGVSFLDFEMTDEKGNHLRSMIMPFAVEQAWSKQDDGTNMLDRHETAIDLSMFRFVASDASGDAQLDVFRAKFDTIDTPGAMPPPITGFFRVSPLAFAVHKEGWSYELDGGWLGTDSPMQRDCKTERCYRGFYAGAIKHAWTAVSVEARAERTGIMTFDMQPAFEDRGSVTVDATGNPVNLSTSAFVARSAMWDGDHTVHRAGLRATVTEPLPHGFSCVADSEIAHADAITPATPRETDARMLVSLVWQKRTTR